MLSFLLVSSLFSPILYFLSPEPRSPRMALTLDLLSNMKLARALVNHHPLHHQVQHILCLNWQMSLFQETD